MQQPAQNLENKIKEIWPKDGPSSLEVEKYIKKYSKEKIVIKCGGKVLLDQSLLNNLIETAKVKTISRQQGLSSADIICSLNILIPHVVDPAQPPTNIRKMKNIRGNSPHKLKSSVTYPVPDKIEITLNAESLKLSKKVYSVLVKNR